MRFKISTQRYARTRSFKEAREQRQYIINVQKQLTEQSHIHDTELSRTFSHIFSSNFQSKSTCVFYSKSYIQLIGRIFNFAPSKYVGR